MPRRIAAVLIVLVGAWRLMVAQEQGLGDTTFALAGDTIMSERLTPFKEPEFLALIEVLRKADVAITNFESIIRNGKGFPTATQATPAHTYMNSPVFVADELKWAGFDMVNHANNHAMDYSFEGLHESVETLRKAGLVVAGAGENLAEAVGPAYFQTAHGRIALIGVASTFPIEGRAGVQSRAFPARPGIATMRFETINEADAQTMAEARQLSQKLRMPPGDGPNGTVQMLGRTFKTASSIRETTVPNAADLKAVMNSIREGRNQADYVVVTIHAHEGRGGDAEVPADFLVTFAHAAIDEGADAFFGHGPHMLRGIEIYKGKPIFYSVGNFSMQNGTMSPQPYDQYEANGLNDASGNIADFYFAREGNDDKSYPADRRQWEAIIAVPTFRNRTLIDIKIHPTDPGSIHRAPSEGARNWPIQPWVRASSSAWPSCRSHSALRFASKMASGWCAWARIDVRPPRAILVRSQIYFEASCARF